MRGRGNFDLSQEMVGDVEQSQLKIVMSELSEPKLTKSTKREELMQSVFEEIKSTPEKEQKLNDIIIEIDKVIKDTLQISNAN